MGSQQQVYIKEKFQPKAKSAYNRCLEAIEYEGNLSANKKWRKVFGAMVPLATTVNEASRKFRDTEEFIEDKYPVDPVTLIDFFLHLVT